MPIYDFECKKCGRKFELRRNFGDDNGASCPECKGDAVRVFTAVPVIFKGSGFYVTDHRKPNPAAETPGTKPSPAPVDKKPVKEAKDGE